MHIHGTPITLASPQDADMADRFWYWQGTSGRKYIHSVYDVDLCPPLPGAVYVGVKRAGHLRIAVTVGRFAPFWDKTLPEKDTARLQRLGVDEVHVHLLARGSDAADDIMKDLSSALGETRVPQGLNESASLWVRAA